MARPATLEEARTAVQERTSAEIRAERRERKRQRLKGMGFSDAIARDRPDIAAAYREQMDPYQHGIKPEDMHDRKSGRRKKRAKTNQARRATALYGGS